MRNLLEVKENDTVGIAVVKKATSAYLTGVLGAGVGLAALYVVVKVVEQNEEEVETEEVEEDKDIVLCDSDGWEIILEEIEEVEDLED